MKRWRDEAYVTKETGRRSLKHADCHSGGWTWTRGSRNTAPLTVSPVPALETWVQLPAPPLQDEKIPQSLSSGSSEVTAQWRYLLPRDVMRRNWGNTRRKRDVKRRAPPKQNSAKSDCVQGLFQVTHQRTWGVQWPHFLKEVRRLGTPSSLFDKDSIEDHNMPESSTHKINMLSYYYQYVHRKLSYFQGRCSPTVSSDPAKPREVHREGNNPHSTHR